MQPVWLHSPACLVVLAAILHGPLAYATPEVHRSAVTRPSWDSWLGASTDHHLNRDALNGHVPSFQVPDPLRLLKRSVAGNNEGSSTPDKRPTPPSTPTSDASSIDGWSAHYATGARHAAYTKARRVLTPAQLGALYELTQRARQLKRLQRHADKYTKLGQPPPPDVDAALRLAEAAHAARLRFGVKVAALLGALSPSSGADSGALDEFLARTVRDLEAELGTDALARYGDEILQGQRGQPGGRLGLAPTESWPAAVERLVAEAEAHEAAGETTWLTKHKTPQEKRAFLLSHNSLWGYLGGLKHFETTGVVFMPEMKKRLQAELDLLFTQCVVDNHPGDFLEICRRWHTFRYGRSGRHAITPRLTHRSTRERTERFKQIDLAYNLCINNLVVELILGVSWPSTDGRELLRAERKLAV